MMSRFLRRSFLVLTCFMVVGIVFALGLPYDDSQVWAFMSAPENCGGTCLLGIHPGVSKVGDTMIQLRSHAWVGEVRQNAPGNGYAQITWDWSGQQPAVIDASRRGRITFYWDDEDTSGPELVDAIIETITVYTKIRIYTLQQGLGEASTGIANIRPDGNLSYSSTYDIPGGMINLTVEIPCPADMIMYWNATTRLTYSIGRVRDRVLNPLETIQSC